MTQPQRAALTTASPSRGIPSRTLDEAIVHAASSLAQEQGPDGAWRGAYGGPLFLLPLYVAAYHVAERPLPKERAAAIARYLFSVQLADGSFGLHDEDASGALFTTTLCYVALRLSGQAASDPRLMQARRWIHHQGGPLAAAPWGKLVLAVLNLYEYSGLVPISPELWLLPRALPLHPGRLWCHARQVYLPMAWLYGSRAKVPVTTTIAELREELYHQPFETIDFQRHRQQLAPSDARIGGSPLLGGLNRALALGERFHLALTRRKALRALLDHISYEDHATHFIRIGPVNAALNTIVRFFSEGRGEALERSFTELEGYIWQDERGALMNGYNSTALWDTAFALQALQASGRATDHPATIRRAHAYIRDYQSVEELPEPARYFRHRSRGGWPFSDRRHGWPISDCTAEGLKCALSLETKLDDPVCPELLEAACELLLSWQNPSSGGWASYELQRAAGWLERLNPSHVFERIMVDYPYVECSSACIQALVQARQRFPQHHAAIDRALRGGEGFIRQQQRADGSWEGSWGVCFSYGTWFAVAGLRAAGAAATDPAIERACRFLSQKQRGDGGFGEHWTSCTQREWIEAPQSHVVQSSWALMTFCLAGQAQSVCSERAAAFLVDRQLSDGSWPRGAMVGVFNRTTLIDYDNYRRYFPLWALSLYRTGRTY